MRILVTGGARFISGHLAESFPEDGHDVTVLDNLEPSTPKGSNATRSTSTVRLPRAGRGLSVRRRRRPRSEHRSGACQRRQCRRPPGRAGRRARERGQPAKGNRHQRERDGESLGGVDRGGRGRRDLSELVVGVQKTGIAAVRRGASHGAREPVRGLEARARANGAGVYRPTWAADTAEHGDLEFRLAVSS